MLDWNKSAEPPVTNRGKVFQSTEVTITQPLKAKLHVPSQSIKCLLMFCGTYSCNLCFRFICVIMFPLFCFLGFFYLNHNKAPSSHIKNKTKTNPKAKTIFLRPQQDKGKVKCPPQMLGAHVCGVTLTSSQRYIIFSPRHDFCFSTCRRAHSKQKTTFSFSCTTYIEEQRWRWGKEVQLGSKLHTVLICGLNYYIWILLQDRGRRCKAHCEIIQDVY